MKYRCRTCKQLLENAVMPSGRFIALNAEPDVTGNLTVDRTRTSVTLAVYVSDKDKERLLIALDGAPCTFYKAHQCDSSRATPEEIEPRSDELRHESGES